MAEVIREAVLIRTAGVRKCRLRMSAPHMLVKGHVHFWDRTPTVQGTTGLPRMCTEAVAQDVYRAYGCVNSGSCTDLRDRIPKVQGATGLSRMSIQSV